MEFVTGYIFLNENLRQGNCFCSLDSERWEDVKKREQQCCINLTSKSYIGLNENAKKSLQSHLDKKVEPFLATHHLFKAIKETDPRHKLINLALALELGIKEYLIRKKSEPEIESLIIKLPSPPLDKLYGDVLKCFSGETTPVKKQIIQKIAENRNKLVHTLDKVDLKSDDIKKYLAATEIALFHLWLDLYPHDEGVNIRYKRLRDQNPSLLNKDSEKAQL